MKPSDISEKDRSRFHAKYTRRTPEECWLWDGTLASNGYGFFSFGGRQRGNVGAHRVSWMLANESEVPDRFQSNICHACDNRRCVNPSHLFIGTVSDNIRDAVKKGYKPRPFPTGENNPLAKITSAIVIAIRASAANARTQRDIAKEFGLSQSTVWAIVNRRIWRHIA